MICRSPAELLSSNLEELLNCLMTETVVMLVGESFACVQNCGQLLQILIGDPMQIGLVEISVVS